MADAATSLYRRLVSFLPAKAVATNNRHPSKQKSKQTTWGGRGRERARKGQ